MRRRRVRRGTLALVGTGTHPATPSECAPEDVVVTGVGIVSALGIGREANWEAALAGRSGAGHITRFDASDYRARTACEVGDAFIPEDYMDRKAARRMDRVCQIAVAAARLALADAGIPTDSALGDRASASIASSIGGAETWERQWRILAERGPDRVGPLTVPGSIANMPAGMVAVECGIRGPVLCPLSACGSSADAIGQGLALLRRGAADIALVGGSEASITPLVIAALAATRALSERNDDPAGASRPFDAGRDGFVPAEGAGVLVLERRADALARGAPILCALAGYGASADAYRPTDPDPTGVGQARAMRAALADAGITPAECGYVNAHATSTPAGDPVEVGAIRQVFGERASEVCVSSTKSLHGHGGGSAGALEAVLTACMVAEGRIVPTINVQDLDPACTGVDHVLGTPREVALSAAMSNSFGFGGHNASIVFRAVRA